MNEYEDKNLGYFTFYPADFLSSTMHLSNEQVGAYMRILCFLWKKKRARETELKAVGYGSVIPNETQWLSIIELLVNDGEFFWSKRMEFEREKAMKGYIVKCENGKKGGRPKKNNPNKTENKPMGYDSVNLNKTDGVSNQNQNHTFNHSSNDINEEDSFFLARDAQENQEPKKIEFEKIDRSVQNQIPTFEEAQAHCDYYQTKFKKKFDVKEWIAHWNAQNWIDKTNRPFDWRKKINDNSADPRFQIKEEKTPLKTFKEIDEENSERTFLLLEVGFQHKEKTTEELKEMVKQKRENDLIIAEQKREEQLAQIEAKKNEVVQIAPVKIKTQAELDEDYLYELRRDYGGPFANANKTLEEMLEIKRKKEEERNRPLKWFDQAKIEQAPTLDASLRDLYGNLLHNY